MSDIAQNALIYPDVSIGDGASIGAFVILGEPLRRPTPDNRVTRIGAKAVIRSHTVIYAGNVIGDDFQTGHGVLVRELNEIGNQVSIGSHSMIEHHVKIGDGVRIHSNVFIPEYSELEEGCWIGPCVTFTNARYPQAADTKRTLLGPTIRRGAKIGAGAVLLPGVVIGRNALVGAGAVVVRDVADGDIVVGNPARVVNNTASLPGYEQIATHSNALGGDGIGADRNGLST